MGVFFEYYWYKDLGIFLFIIPIVSAVWASFNLLINKERTTSQVYLAIFFLITGVCIAFRFYYDRYVASGQDEVMRVINFVFNMPCVIMMLFYFTSLLQPSKLTLKYILGHVMCFLTYALFFVFIHDYILLFKTNSFIEYFRNISTLPVMMRFIGLALLFIFDVYVISTIFRFYSIRKNILNVDKKEWRRLIYILILFLIFAFVSFTWTVSGSTASKVIYGVAATILIFFIYYTGSNQKEIITVDPDENNKDNVGGFNDMTPELKLKMDLLAHFENDKPYLNPDLSLAYVATALGTNRTYLSRLINREFNVNFYHFINDYRINYAMLLKKQINNITIDQLMAASGFKSRSVFYELYKARSGYSPASDSWK